MSPLTFQKGQALGNDYLVVDRADLAFEFTPEIARRLCDRQRGAGSDGVLLCDVSGGEFVLRIINPDGSPAEKSGNGLRIFAAYLHGRGLVGEEWFDVALVRDRVRLRVEEVLDGGLLQIRAEMGRASFRGEDVGYEVAGEVLGVPLALANGATADVHTVSLANPHCVVFVETLDRADFLARAPLLCTHEAFAAGTNVQLARVGDGGALEAWIWERGAGETLASGSSACAVAAAAVRRGFIAPGTHDVRMPGGSVEVDVSPAFDIRLRGPAQMVYSGVVRADVVAGWAVCRRRAASGACLERSRSGLIFRCRCAEGADGTENVEQRLFFAERIAADGSARHDPRIGRHPFDISPQRTSAFAAISAFWMRSGRAGSGSQHAVGRRPGPKSAHAA